MKALVYIPVFHTVEEMGPLDDYAGEGLEQYKEGKDWWVEKIAHLWVLIENGIRDLGLFDPKMASKLYVFLDTIRYGTDPEKLKEFLEKSSKENSPMASIALELQSQGATLSGAEDWDIMQSISDVVRRCIKEEEELDIDFITSKTEARNLAIIENIDKIVPDGCMALLLLGMEHNGILEIEGLHQRFKVVTPIGE